MPPNLAIKEAPPDIKFTTQIEKTFANLVFITYETINQPINQN